MNTDVITLNECTNDGTYLHLYFDALTNVWAAYGLSAYGLRLFGKNNGYNTLRGFSGALQMPCTVVGPDAIPLLLRQATVLQYMNDTYLQIRMREAVDRRAYTQWTGRLRG